MSLKTASIRRPGYSNSTFLTQQDRSPVPLSAFATHPPNSSRTKLFNCPEQEIMLSAGSRAFSALARPQLRNATLVSARSPAALRRLLSALAILEQRDGQLNTGSLSAITAAQKLGGPVHAFVAGSSIKSVAEEAAKVEGVEKIIAVENGAYDKVG